MRRSASTYSPPPEGAELLVIEHRVSVALPFGLMKSVSTLIAPPELLDLLPENTQSVALSVPPYRTFTPPPLVLPEIVHRVRETVPPAQDSAPNAFEEKVQSVAMMAP